MSSSRPGGDPSLADPRWDLYDIRAPRTRPSVFLPRTNANTLRKGEKKRKHRSSEDIFCHQHPMSWWYTWGLFLHLEITHVHSTQEHVGSLMYPWVRSLLHSMFYTLIMTSSSTYNKRTSQDTYKLFLAMMDRWEKKIYARLTVKFRQIIIITAAHQERRLRV